MLKKIFILVFSLSIGAGESSSQCDSDSFVRDCISHLATGFNFLKTYKINAEGGKQRVEFSYVFTKGTQYMVNLCANGEMNDLVIISLFDSNRDQVATSKIQGQVVSAITYTCNSTGIYYIQYSFASSSKCGGSALGFKRPS